jgi:hypothetical protein
MKNENNNNLPQLEQLMDEVCDFAEFFLMFHNHLPTGFVGTSPDDVFVLKQRNNDHDDFIRNVRLECVAHAATLGVLLEHRWMAKRVFGHLLEVTTSPTEFPDSIEIIYLAGQVVGGLEAVNCLPIIRDSSGIVTGFGELLATSPRLIVAEDVLLPSSTPTDRDRQIARSMLAEKGLA